MRLRCVSGVEFGIDDDDACLVDGASFHWTGRYVMIYFPASKYGARNQYREYLHKFLLDERGEVDHIDGDTLNNHKSNLRPATGTQQNHNRRSWGNYPQGITFDERKQLYRARVQIGGKRVGLGRFKRLEDAIAARKKYDK